MRIRHRKSDTYHPARIDLVSKNDYAKIKKGSWNFDWGKEREFETYKLTLESSGEIFGLMSIVDLASEKWLKVNLLEVSENNLGMRKEYDHVAGCLLAFACRSAFARGYDGYVALVPKTGLVKHYMKCYGFRPAGRHLCLGGETSWDLIKKYLDETE